MYPLLETLSIATGTAFDAQRAAVSLVVDAHAQKADEPHGAVYRIDLISAVELGFFPFSIVALIFHGRTEHDLIALGDWGDVRVFSSSGVTEERIEPLRGPLRGLAQVTGTIYACGADLQVFARSAPGAWDDVGPPEALRSDFPRNHFEAIAGFGPGELYAAGRNGVLWWYDGARWRAVQCPTNLSFYAVTCGGDGQVYACGQAGLFAVGREDRFEISVPVTPLVDLWGVAEVGGKAFVAGMRVLLAADGLALAPVPAAMVAGRTFYDICTRNGVLWSFGAKDVLRSDGARWARIDRVQVS